MLTLKTINSRTHACQRCKSHFRVIYPPTRAAQAAFMNVHRRGKIMETIKELRKLTDCGLADAKGTVMHIGCTPGECHWCRKPIPPVKFSDCPHCTALNIHPESNNN